MKRSLALLALVALVGCGESRSFPYTTTPTTQATKPTTPTTCGLGQYPTQGICLQIPTVPPITIDPAALAWLNHFDADRNALGVTVNRINNERNETSAVHSDCALGRNQVSAVRIDLDTTPHMPGATGSLRQTAYTALDELDAGFVDCAADNWQSMVSHMNVGISLSNRLTQIENGGKA